MIVLRNFWDSRRYLSQRVIEGSYPIHTDFWQGENIREKPEAEMREVFGESFRIFLNGVTDLDHWKKDIAPNLPWADDHFLERIGGEPLNPGEEWKNWPWSLSADRFRTQGEQFDHTYMERFWPKHAGHVTDCSPRANDPESSCESPNRGIRFEYADLNDLIDHIAKDPLTRQAYLPIWFPEDGTCQGRKPCTLGYWFLVRHGYMHLTYYIRSCDLLRHYSDDCYLAIRLLLHILRKLQERDESWKKVVPGSYTMHIGSLHVFINDYHFLKNHCECLLKES